MNEVESLIAKFNVDPENAKLISFYQSETIWRILGIERDECKHSAYLKWLLESHCESTYSPFLQFLNILVRNAETADQISSKLKRAILLNDFSIKNLSVDTEMTIPHLSDIKYNDRLDLFISCEIVINSEQKKLEIILENKVESKEGGPKTNKETSEVKDPDEVDKIYATLHQTERYYFACNNNEGGHRKSEGKEALQLFVFLSPSDGTPKDKHFIKISYQDIVDFILQPQLSRQDISKQFTFKLTDYLRTLSTPLNKKYITMATITEEKQLLLEFFNKNKDLFMRAAEAASKSADSEEESEALNSIVCAIRDSDKARNRFFKVNGNPTSYRMYEVIAEYVKYRCSNDETTKIASINKELGEAGGEKTKDKIYRVIVSTVDTGPGSVYRSDLHQYESKLKDGTTFYVTKELGMSKEDKNFGGIMKYINENDEGFTIEEIQQ